MSFSARKHRLVLLGLTLFLGGAGVAAYFLWPRKHPLPARGSPQYQEHLRAFQVGVAALDAGQHTVALKSLEQAVKLIPDEPAGWANLGLLHLRKNEFDQAAKELKKAKEQTPPTKSGEIESLLGLLAEKQGRFSEAVSHLREAIKNNPRDVGSLYSLAEVVHKESGPESEADYGQLLDQILQVQPTNLKVLVLKVGAAARLNDRKAIDETLKRLEKLAPGWKNAVARKTLDEARSAAGASTAALIPLLAPLDISLNGELGYRRGANALAAPSGEIGTSIQQFLVLEAPLATPAPADRELTFSIAPWASSRPVAAVERSSWDVIRPIRLIPEAQRASLVQTAQSGGATTLSKTPFELAVLLANAQEVRRADTDADPMAFPGGPRSIPPTPAGILPVDWDNDYRIDLVLAGAGGLRFWHQEPGGSFKDMTGKTRLPPELLEGDKADYYGAWAADIDMDGDLDIVVARRSGSVLVLRNNRDGTFKAVEEANNPFASVKDARAFVWADFDNDGAPDAAFLDASGRLHVFMNERSGLFSRRQLPENLGTFLALTAADVNDDGIIDLVALRTDGKLVRISENPEKRGAVEVAELAQWPGPKDTAPGVVNLFAADLDNNGAVDLIVAGPAEAHIYLADENRKLELLTSPVPLRVFAVLDLDRDGRLDLLGLSNKGQPTQALGKGTKDYHWQVLWPLGNPKEGDNRSTSFGIGGEIEIRAGLLVQKQTITDPEVHFGLGEQSGGDVARIVWPTGVPQWEFTPGWPQANTLVAAVQRLSGSCPFLFTDDGTGMRFVGDFMWSTPLGMHVNGQDQGDFPQTTEWLQIPGHFLKPRGGYYDVRVHANLWETDYFDQLALIVVDHPPGTEIYADERFFLTPTAPRLYVTTPARPVAQALDHNGEDVTDLVRAIDGRYLDRAGRGRFQGVTRDHWVEVDLGANAPKEGPVYLIARGWVHPTNSSINVAIEQGSHDRPRPLVLEVPDGRGGWKVGRDKLGFPAGKDKTILIRLDGIEGKSVSRRFRLRTNMEIFWDFLGYAQELDSKLARQQRLEPTTAELRYRGLLEMTQKDFSSPEIPQYDKVIHGQRWRDLTGFYTRYGDVRELLARVDDRYVIMNAGDEIAFRFPVPASPPPGWQRDFVWECDGWTKDGDANTRFGTTVLPLPAHELKTNDRPPGRLEDDPVYRRFPHDWQNYHTRYVTPDEFARGLRTFRRPVNER
jgi:tetratricopeptide (TPR) repeat protein